MQKIERPPSKSRWLTVISVIWFFGFLEMLAFLPALGANPPDWFIPIGVAGGLLWMLSGYWIYHTLFTLAEARWPAAKGIREIVGPLLKGLLFHQHHK